VDLQVDRYTKRKLLFAYIRQNNGISRLQLADKLGLHKAIVEDIVEELIDNHFIKEISPALRRSDIYSVGLTVNTEYHCAIGIGVTSCNSIVVVLCDLLGTILHSIRVDSKNEFTVWQKTILSAINQMLVKAYKRGLHVIGAGIAVAGLVNPIKKEVMYSTGLDLIGNGLVNNLIQNTGLQIFIENEANATALAQWVFGQGKNLGQRLLYVVIGQDIHAGIIDNGEIYYGDLFSAGMIGHVIIDPLGKPCKCGLRGCLDTIVTRNPDTGIINMKNLGTPLGQAIATFVNLNNINSIFIGAHEDFSECFWPQLTQAFSEYSIDFIRRRTSIIASTLGRDAAAIGGAAIVLKRLYDFVDEICTGNKESNAELQNQKIDKMKSFISENYNKDITLTKVADYIGLNHQYLSRLFKSVTGENFIDYLNKLRIRESKKLILNLDVNLYTISQMVGFANEQAFVRFFKKYEGCTPSQYREKHKQK